MRILATDLITNLQDSQRLSRSDEMPLDDEQVIRTRTKARRVEKREEEDEYKHCIVVIDVYSKYVELGALKSKSSNEIADWFDTRILCRYGSPFVLRSD